MKASTSFKAAVHLPLLKAMLLCIDDDKDVWECEKSFLESFSYAVLTGPSGRRGLEVASARSIDVVMEKMSLAGPA
jgi:response regulator RpfG family c-di-GMP phosphodiesterase